MANARRRELGRGQFQGGHESVEKRTSLAVFTCGFQGAGLVTVGSLLLLLNLLVSKFNVLFSWIDTVTLLRKFNNDILVSNMLQSTT